MLTEIIKVEQLTENWEQLNMLKQKGVTLWFTGLSGAGKTTVALEVEKRLRKKGLKVEILDGDAVRNNLSPELGFSPKERSENIRRISYIAQLLTRNDVITLCPVISPYQKDREEARRMIGNFVEIYVNTPLAVCEQRDVKGLYQKARLGEIVDFTGISDPYEQPTNPDIEIDTEGATIEECADKIIKYLLSNKYLEA
jgi:adenylylsulfate kinase